jgi:hypothetical protein
MQEYFKNLIKLDEGGNYLPAPPLVRPRPVEDSMLVALPDTQ